MMDYFKRGRKQTSIEGIALEWLAQVAVNAQLRINNGDLDFDDVLYRGRDAALTLLDIFASESGERTDEG